MARLASILATAPILLLGAASAQSPCACSGSALHLSNGGDSAPLTWSFCAVEKQAGAGSQQQIISYGRIVENHSIDEVRDIQWKVAGYGRKVIPPQTPMPSCIDIPGGLKPVPDNGPLHYGTSSQAYDTTVRQPADGWFPKKAAVEDSSYKPLRAEFVFAATTKKDGLQEAHIVIYSFASYDPDKKQGNLRFQIINSGKSDVLMFLNFPDAASYFSPEKPFYAGKDVKYEIPVWERPEPKPTTVVFYNADGQIAALDTAGLYVPATGKIKFSDEQLWSSH